MSLSQDINEFSPLIIGLSGSSGFTDNTTNVVVVSYPSTNTAIRLIEAANFLLLT